MPFWLLYSIIYLSIYHADFVKNEKCGVLPRFRSLKWRRITVIGNQEWKKKKPRLTTTSSPEKAKEPPGSNKVLASPPTPTSLPNPAQLSLLPLHSSAISLELRALPKLPNLRRKPSSNPFKTSSRRNPFHPPQRNRNHLGFPTEATSQGVLIEILLGGVGTGEVVAETSIGKGTEIRGGGVGVERDIRKETLREGGEGEAGPEAFRMRIGGTGVEGGVEAFLLPNEDRTRGVGARRLNKSRGRRGMKVILEIEGEWVNLVRKRRLGLITRGWFKVMTRWYVFLFVFLFQFSLYMN